MKGNKNMSSNVPEIHQLLAALPDIEAENAKIREESIKLFEKRELLNGYIKVLIMNDDARKDEEKGAGEKKEITTSVMTRLKYAKKFIVRNIDAQLQREKANQIASARVVLPSGEEVEEDLPVLYLMSLEKELIREREMLNRAPTIDTLTKWAEDADADLEGIRVSAEPVRTNKTELRKVPVSVAPPTKEHKEQVIIVDENKTVGYYETTKVTGCLTPAEKAAGLAYFDTLIKEVKQAKSRANKAVVQKYEIGEKIVDGLLEAIRNADRR
jgi:hypothetical protein